MMYICTCILQNDFVLKVKNGLQDKKNQVIIFFFNRRAVYQFILAHGARRTVHCASKGMAAGMGLSWLLVYLRNRHHDQTTYKIKHLIRLTVTGT